MNKIVSRLMAGSALAALALAIPLTEARAAQPAVCQGTGGCPTDGEPWTVMSGASELVSGTFSPSSLSVDGPTNPSVTVDANATLNDDAVIGDASFGTMTNNGTHNVSGNLVIGNQSTGVGSYTIQGNTAQTNVSFVSGGDGSGNPNGALIVGNAGS